jgi:Ser-tRNA(Ala) deacylase AlaX
VVEKLFWSDPYQTRAEARITSVQDNCITLDRTIFFAFSGGQESDQGTINQIPVLAANWHQQEIIYTLVADHGLIPGQVVSVEINWPRRYRLMRLHFACEITLELIYKARPGIEKIGAHIAEDKARIDFLSQDNLSALLPDLKQRIDALVQQNLPIHSDYSDQSKGRRYWRIDGFAQVPCGGTHLRHTQEIGTVTLKRKNPGKGKERIEIYVDE